MQNRYYLELARFGDCVVLVQSLDLPHVAAPRYVTQPVFNRHIVSLKEWLGAPVFEHNRRDVNLTCAGEVFVAQVPELIQALHTLRNETTEVVGNPRSDIIFSTMHSLSFSFFPALMRDNEEIAYFSSFRLLPDTFSVYERMIERGDAQFLLCYCHPHMYINLDQTKYLSVRLGREMLLLYSERNPRFHQSFWQATGGKKLPFLSSPAEPGLGRVFSNASSVNHTRCDVDIVFTADLTATLLAMTRIGDGIAWLPESLAVPDVQVGMIVAAASQKSGLWIPTDVRLSRPAGRMSRAVRKLWGTFADEQR